MGTNVWSEHQACAKFSSQFFVAVITFHVYSFMAKDIWTSQQIKMASIVTNGDILLQIYIFFLRQTLQSVFQTHSSNIFTMKCFILTNTTCMWLFQTIRLVGKSAKHFNPGYRVDDCDYSGVYDTNVWRCVVWQCHIVVNDASSVDFPWVNKGSWRENLTKDYSKSKI